MAVIYRVVPCGACGKNNVFGPVGGITQSGESIPLPFEDDFEMTCGSCKHTDTYGVSLIETEWAEKPFSDSELQEHMNRFRFQ